MTFNFLQYPRIHSFTIPGDKEKMLEKAKSDGCLDIWLSAQGKTAIDIGVGRDNDQFRMNNVSDPAYKYKESNYMNWFSGEPQKSMYFKLLKNQGPEELKKHLEILVKKLFPTIKIHTLNVYISDRIIDRRIYGLIEVREAV